MGKGVTVCFVHQLVQAICSDYVQCILSDAFMVLCFKSVTGNMFIIVLATCQWLSALGCSINLNLNLNWSDINNLHYV